MQFKHVTLDIDGPVAILKLDHQEVMNAVSIDMLGGLSEALDVIEEKRAEVRCLVITRRRTRVLHRRQSAGPQQPEAGQEQRPARRWKPRSIRSCGVCAICIARSSPRSTDRPPAPA